VVEVTPADPDLQLERTATLVERVVAQTRVRLAGGVPDGSTRVVSLHDADARPIAKGRLGKPVEFGYKAQVVDGVVLDHRVVIGNPPDAPMLVPAIARITARFGRPPTAVTADRGYGEAKVDAELEASGVKRVAIPRRGKPGVARQKVQRGSAFTKLVKWRTGSEARISHLKRDYGWARTRVASTASAAPRRGAGGACSPTTPPRSAPFSRRQPPRPLRSPQHRRGARPTPEPAHREQSPMHPPPELCLPPTLHSARLAGPLDGPNGGRRRREGGNGATGLAPQRNQGESMVRSPEFFRTK
jgi:IS5 family transposase